MNVRSFDVLWTGIARRDLRSVVLHIAVDDVPTARNVRDRLWRRAGKLTTYPSRGRIVPELKIVGVLQYRELIERPWRIIYRIEQQTVLVTAVLDSRQDLETVLLQRLVQMD